MKTLIQLIAITALAFSQMGGCATTGQLTPQQRAALTQVELAALNTAVSVGTQYAANGKIDTSQLIINSIDSAANAARTVIGTDAAFDPDAVKEAMQSGSSSTVVDNKVAPPVADAVAKAISKGAKPDDAVEAAARGLNKGARKLKGK